MAAKSTSHATRKPAVRKAAAKPTRKTTKLAAAKPSPSGNAKATKRPASPAAKPVSKQAALIALLQSPSGGTMPQMMKLTGWQPHSVRGVLSGVIKKKLGFTLASAVPAHGGDRHYRIESRPAQT